jgi:hypothetical protein
LTTSVELGVNRDGMPPPALRVRPVTELGWESTDQFAAADPAAYVLLQHFTDRRDGGRTGACYLDSNGQLIDKLLMNDHQYWSSRLRAT